MLGSLLLGCAAAAAQYYPLQDPYEDYIAASGLSDIFQGPHSGSGSNQVNHCSRETLLRTHYSDHRTIRDNVCSVKCGRSPLRPDDPSCTVWNALCYDAFGPKARSPQGDCTSGSDGKNGDEETCPSDKEFFDRDSVRFITGVPVDCVNNPDGPGDACRCRPGELDAPGCTASDYKDATYDGAAEAEYACHPNAICANRDDLLKMCLLEDDCTHVSYGLTQVRPSWDARRRSATSTHADAAFSIGFLHAGCTEMQDTIEKLSDGSGDTLRLNQYDSNGVHKEMMVNGYYLLAPRLTTRTEVSAIGNCALGKGIQLSAPADPDLQGLYVMSGGSYCSTPDMMAKGCYEHEVGGHVIEPHYSGCSWVVSRKQMYAEGWQDCERTDKNDALNWVLGQCDDINNCAADPDYVPNLCQTMTTIWSGDEGGHDGHFCTNRVFKGLCPETCGLRLKTPCDNDMGGSVEWWAIMHPGEELPHESDLVNGQLAANVACNWFDARGECDPVIQNVCPLGGDHDYGRTACHEWSARRLTGGPSPRVAPEVAQAFRRSLSKTPKRRLAGTPVHDPVGNNVAYEMMDRTNDHFYLREVYVDVEPKFDDGFLNADCRDYSGGGRTTSADYDSSGSANPNPWMSGQVYRVADLLEEKTSVSIQVDCGVSKTRWNEKYETFCELDNINSKYHRDPRVVTHRCSHKCVGKTVDEVDAHGNHSYCDGNGFTPDTPDLPNITNRIGLDLASTKKDEDSLALCLPRSRCEQLCDEIDECKSIDMHRYRNRCYLNLVDHTTGTCSADGNYDLIYKRSTRANWFAEAPLSEAGEYTHFDDIERHTWVTYELDCSHIDSENEITLNDWAKGGETGNWDNGDYTFKASNNYWLSSENNENSWSNGDEDTWFKDNLDSYDNGNTGVTREYCEYLFSAGTRRGPSETNPDEFAYDGIAGFQFEYLDGDNGGANTLAGGFSGNRAVGRCKPIGWKDLPKKPDGTPNCPAANTTRWDHNKFRPKTYFVMKVAYEPCTAEVSGVDATFDGTYVQLVDAQVLPAYDNGGAFEYGTWGKLDNSTQIVYRRPDRATPSDGCGAWYFEENKESPVSRTVHNCTDQPEAAATYYALLSTSNYTSAFDGPLNADGMPGLEFPCQWAKERGNCTTVLKKLCPHTCQPVLRVRTETSRQNYWRNRGQPDYEESDPASQTYFFQDTDAAGCAAGGNTVDSDGTFKTFVNLEWTSFNAGQLPSSVNGLSAKYDGNSAGFCDSILGTGAGYWYTYGRWPCEDLPEAPIVRALCQTTCATVDPPPAPPGASPTLENTPDGALQRRLAARSGQTTSYATAGTSITFSWTPFPQYDLSSIRTSWDAHYSTQVNGSHDVNRWHAVLGTPALSNVPGGEPHLAGSDQVLATSTVTCPHTYGTAQDGKSAANYLAFNDQAFSWYSLKMAPAPGVSINKVCAEAPLCPPLTKCFLTPKRFTDEMSSFRMSHSVARSAYVSSIDGDEKDQFLADSNFVPRVLVSNSRVEAVFRGARSVAVAGSLARADVEATRFDIDRDPARTDFGEYTIVTVAPAAQRCDTGTDLPCGELGRTYTAPAGGVGYTLWRSDVLRVERFDEDRQAKPAGSFTFTVTMPGGDVSGGTYKVYRYPPAAHSEPVDVESEGGVVEKLAPGVVRVTTVAVNSDFAVIEDADECQGHLQFGDDEVLDFQACDHEVGTCVNTLGSYECHCPSDTHVAQPAEHRVDTVECVPKHAEHFDYYLRITHLDRLNYGWRVQDVRLFEEPDCSGQAIGAGNTQPWKEYCPEHVGDGAYTTGCLGVSEQRTTQAGSAAYRNFNGDDHTAADNLGRHGDEWWSGCLTCNPDEFDESHGSAASLLVLVDQSVTVQCVELRHNNGMYATNRIKVERGPLVDVGCHIDTNRCVPTMTWQGEGGGATQGQRLDIQVSTTCGTVGRHIYGEIITPNEMSPITAGVTPHYANMVDVSSACHCQTLCLRTLDNGCESWSYKPQANTPCVLQGKVLHSEVSMADWGGYTSGLPHESVHALGGDLSTAPVLRGAGLVDGVLTLTGYGFPTRENGADKSRYQRVKLVESGAPCHSAVPSSVTGISCLATTLDNGSGGKRSVHTVCSTRPSDAAADGRSVSWSGIGLVGNHLSTDYDVCYCSGKSCHLPGSWSKVTQGAEQATVWPGLAAGGTGHYTFTAEVDGTAGHEVPREGASLALVVDVDLAATDVADWELKVVPSQFDCSVDPHVFPAPSKSDETVNSAKFTFDVNGTVSDVGTYHVCFRGDAASAWTQIFHKDADLVAGSHVLALTEHSAGDRTHPRAVYTNQFWSAQSGAEARELHLAGTGLPTPTDSKVYFSSGGCGSANYHFGGSVVKKSADAVAPSLVVSQIEPPSGTSANLVTVLELAFDEIVQAADGCVGSYHLIAADGTVGLSVHCTNATYYANTVQLDISALQTDGTYSLVIDAYVVADLADVPNVALRIAPDNYELTIQGGPGTTGVAPRLLHAHSYDATAANIAASNSYTSSPLELVWSEEVALTTDYGLKMDLYSCGADFVCNSTDDVLLWTYRVVALGGGSNVTWDANVSAISVDGRTVSVDLEAVPGGLEDATRYLLRFDTGAINDGAGGDIDGFDVEVVRHFAADGYDYANVISASAASTGSKYAFDVALVAEEGSYSVCYCDEMQDENHLVRGDGDATYKVTQDAIGGSDGSGNATVGSRGLDEHVCQDKCHSGCLGDDCFCDGWDNAPSGAYCLSPQLCREACDAIGCSGISTRGNTCLLATSGGSEASVGWQFFARVEGSACTDLDDFTEVGTLTVTDHVDLGVTYVVAPGKATTFEVTGANILKPLEVHGGHRFHASRGRIMVVDCDGQCGASGPAKGVFKAGSDHALTLEDYIRHAPVQHYEDPAGDGAGSRTTEQFAPTAQAMEYLPMPDRYCPEGNIDLSSANVAIDGMLRSAGEHQCYRKCLLDGCDEETGNCHCSGALSGFDGPDSNAVCGDLDLCQALCDGIASCTGFDKHQSLDRCFLNLGCGSGHESDLQPDPKYTFYKRTLDPAAQDDAFDAGRRLHDDASLPALDRMVSYPSMLRYTDLEFQTGGSYKMCFCDGASGCNTAEDFTLQVGTVEASGMACLLETSTYSRSTCVGMGVDGQQGLRCYAGDAPEVEITSLFPPAEGQAAGAGAGQVPDLDTYCVLHPERCGIPPR